MNILNWFKKKSYKSTERDILWLKGRIKQLEEAVATLQKWQGVQGATKICPMCMKPVHDTSDHFYLGDWQCAKV